MKAIWWAATAEQPPQNDHTNDARRDLESIGFICLKGSELAAAVRRSDAIDDLGSDTPDKINISSVRYERDQKIREAVKRRAGGKCEFCGEPGFVCSDGSRYLESHHIIALANDGADRMTNVIALCPGDHREAHFGARRVKLEKEMIRKVRIAEEGRDQAV